MNEKIYKTMTTVGAGNIVLGVIMIVTGIAAGVITIVGGARLLKNKSGLTFESGKRGIILKGCNGEV